MQRDRHLGPRAAELLAFVHLRVIETGTAPSYSEIADELGMWKCHVGRIVAALEQRGLFKAYHLGRKSKWKDWQRAWETWVLNSVGFVRPRIESSSSKEFDLVESILAEHGRKPP